MRKLALLLIPALTAGVLSALPQAAHAAVDQACTVTEAVTYSPPVTNTAQVVTTTVHGNLFDCTDSSAPDGTYTETLTAPGVTCTTLLDSASGTRVFHWPAPTAPSTFAFNLTSIVINGTAQVTFLGEITAGTFTPDPAKEVIAGPVLNPLACMTTGVSQTTYVGALEIGA
jgi:hypothetical protein